MDQFTQVIDAGMAVYKIQHLQLVVGPNPALNGFFTFAATKRNTLNQQRGV
jgi:hypothetical protein